MTKEAFYIASWLIEPSLNRIHGPDGAISVEPRIMRIVTCLAEQPGKVVLRDTLMDVVWGTETIVGDGSLTGSISELRKIFHDDPHQPHLIETIRSRGYRLIAPVTASGRAARDEDLITPARYEGDGYGVPAVSPVLEPSAAARLARPAYRAYLLLPLLLAACIGAGFILAEGLRSDPVKPTQRITPLTTLPGVEYGPAFSPDGRRVAFVRFDEALHTADLYVRSMDVDNPIRLTDLEGAEFYPTWSPDGQFIAFVWNRLEGCGIYKVPATGGPIRKVWETNYSIRHLNWSPDGAWLAFSYAIDELGTQQIYRLHLNTLALHPVTAHGTGYSDYWPVFSPDGSRLAFRRMTSDQSEDLYIIPVAPNETTLQRLTFDDVPLRGFAWTPDGNQIMFASHREAMRGLWTIPSTGGSPRLLRTLDTKDMNHFTLAPQGNRAAYIQETTEVNIWQFSGLSSAHPLFMDRPLLASTHHDKYLQFSPDGQRIAFISTRSGNPELWLATPDGTQLMKLTNLDNATTTLPSWSPDGTRLAFEMRTDDQADLYLVDADGGLPRRFIRSDANEVAPQWSRDGRYMYFGSDRSGMWQIWKAPVKGGDPVQITETGGYAGIESADGTALFFTKRDKPYLWELSFETNQIVQRTDTLYNQSLHNFVSTATGLYFLNWTVDESVFKIYQLAWDTRQTKYIATLPPKTVHYYYQWGLAVSPDEQTVLYGSIDRAESDIMVVENVQ